MKKITLLFSILIAMLVSIPALNAACTGSSAENPVIFCGSEEVSQAYNDAIANCCAGNEIFYDDVCSGVTGSWDIGLNGAGGTCSPT